MSRSSHSRIRVAAPTVAPAAPERLPIAYALRDLAVAPENLRFGEAADDGVPELAAAVLAAGLLQPLTVRAGRGQEHPAMVLDGRRRLMALGTLLEAGRIADDYPVSCFVESDPGRQAAAIVLTNTALPVHPADVIVAIGKMLAAKLTIAAVAAALGHSELEVRRLAALSALHPKALEALRSGRCSLRQARLLARLPDRDMQGEIAEAAISGFGFQEWRVTEQLDAGAVTSHDRRYGFVGAARYAAAGGRIESDLFGERADAVLDPDRLQAAWTLRAQAFADVLVGDLSCDVVVSVDDPEIDDGSLEPFGYTYGMGLGTEPLAAWRSATDVAAAARSKLLGRDLSDAGIDVDIERFLTARIAADMAGEPSRQVGLITLFADRATGLDVRLWGPRAPADDRDADLERNAGGPDDAADIVAGELTVRGPRPTAFDPSPLATAPPAELEGVNHGLHEVRTDFATRALVRALADDPSAALVAVTARLFVVVVLGEGVGRGGGALSLRAEAYSRPNTPPIGALDGEVRRRLAERRAAWEASGLTPIAWTAKLADSERMGLLAEVVALSLDVREERTTSLRRGARADAAEIAALCSADVTRFWTPDAAFLRAHPKARLLDMLDRMGVDEPRAITARKDDLVALVAEEAAERRWAPAYLSWATEPSDDTSDGLADALDGDDDGGDPAAAA